MKIKLTVQTTNAGAVVIETTDKDYRAALTALESNNGLNLGSVFVPTKNIIVITLEVVEKEDTNENKKQEGKRQASSKSNS